MLLPENACKYVQITKTAIISKSVCCDRRWRDRTPTSNIAHTDTCMCCLPITQFWSLQLLSEHRIKVSDVISFCTFKVHADDKPDSGRHSEQERGDLEHERDSLELNRQLAQVRNHATEIN